MSFEKIIDDVKTSIYVCGCMLVTAWPLLSIITPTLIEDHNNRENVPFIRKNSQLVDKCLAKASEEDRILQKDELVNFIKDRGYHRAILDNENIGYTISANGLWVYIGVEGKDINFYGTILDSAPFSGRDPRTCRDFFLIRPHMMNEYLKETR